MLEVCGSDLKRRDTAAAGTDGGVWMAVGIMDAGIRPLGEIVGSIARCCGYIELCLFGPKIIYSVYVVREPSDEALDGSTEVPRTVQYC